MQVPARKLQVLFISIILAMLAIFSLHYVLITLAHTSQIPLSARKLLLNPAILPMSYFMFSQ